MKILNFRDRAYDTDFDGTVEWLKKHLKRGMEISLNSITNQILLFKYIKSCEEPECDEEECCGYMLSCAVPGHEYIYNVCLDYEIDQIIIHKESPSIINRIIEI